MLPSGVKRVRKTLATAEVRSYFYHRATGTRIKADPFTAAGLLEIAALDAKAAKIAEATDARSFAALWNEYRDSQEWRDLAPRTRSDYQAVRDWLGQGAERMIVKAVTPPEVVMLRDKAARQRGRRFANYVVAVVRLVFAWGVERGWRDENPAAGVSGIPRPKSAPKVNRAWRPAEIAAFVEGCPVQLLTPFALGLFAGMRQGDALRVTWAAYDGATLRWIASKNGEACEAPVIGAFKAVLDNAKAKRGKALQIAVNASGSPWTANGYRASFFKRIRALKDDPRVSPGLTFHGLRYTVGASARSAGASDFATASAIGDRSIAMAALYGRDAERITAQATVLIGVQERLGNVGLETAMETDRETVARLADVKTKKSRK